MEHTIAWAYFFETRVEVMEVEKEAVDRIFRIFVDILLRDLRLTWVLR